MAARLRSGGTLELIRNGPDRVRPDRRPSIYRLVLWNIDLTLVDVARVSRIAYAEAFRRVTGQPLVAPPQFSGKGDSEIFFESLALNGVDAGPSEAGADELLARYCWELATAFHARRRLLTEQGRLLPGAREAVAATAQLPGAVQSVLTGAIKSNATDKLRAFGLADFFDLDVGGYGSDVYPKGTQLVMSCGRQVRGPHRSGRDCLPGRFRPGRRGGQDRRRALRRRRDRPVYRRGAARGWRGRGS